MPAIYAHARFGHDVLDLLTDSTVDSTMDSTMDFTAESAADAAPSNASAAARIIRANRPLFDIGLQGPDIFFYYNPLHHNPIGQLGSDLHEKSGREVFTHFSDCLSGASPAHIAYLYGFLCHYALDVTCHRYVDQTAAETGITHLALESEFERFLMETDGVDPLSEVLTKSIRPSLASACIISRFFAADSSSSTDGTFADAFAIQKSLNMIVRYHALLRSPGKNLPGRFKRSVLKNGMKLAGISGFLIPDTPDPRCVKTNAELIRLYEKALPLAADMIERFLSDPELLSDPVFDRNFESQIPQ